MNLWYLGREVGDKVPIGPSILYSIFKYTWKLMRWPA